MPDKSKDLETDAYLAAWAKELAASVTPAEHNKLVDDYRKQAGNARRSADDRTFAERRGDALSKFQKRNR